MQNLAYLLINLLSLLFCHPLIIKKKINNLESFSIENLEVTEYQIEFLLFLEYFDRINKFFSLTGNINLINAGILKGPIRI